MHIFRNFRWCSLGRILNKKNCNNSTLLVNVLCLNVCRLCVPNIMSLGACFIKKIALVKVGACAWYIVKICVIFGVRFERQKVDKKSKPIQKPKHGNSILEYCECFWEMSSKSIGIICELYRFKVCAFFLRHSVYLTLVELLGCSCRICYEMAMHIKS